MLTERLSYNNKLNSYENQFIKTLGEVFQKAFLQVKEATISIAD